jgi:alkanesulfonate monooxygenase SsuD/methylene tetrahydromethanopterin reductase-like flavin-dependent oxidoreductase (luciferase family)
VPTRASTVQRGLAVPCFAEDPAWLVELGTAAERAGFDGYFLWDHLLHSDSGQGPPVVDPWQVLALVAVGTSRIRVGTMITPLPRRRPWKLAKEATTLDLLSSGRVILGVGLGAPAHGEFRLFGEPPEPRVRAELLDEGLAVLAGLQTGNSFSYTGKHFTIGPVQFSPRPVQRPRIPIWVGGHLPRGGPLTRAARWDGFIPIHPERPDGVATPEDIAAARDRIATLRGRAEGFDIAVWGTLDDGTLAARLPGYAAAGATWWIESVRTRPGWQEAITARLQVPARPADDEGQEGG